MNDHDRLRLRHILDAIASIESYMKVTSYEEFGQNPMVFDSITNWKTCLEDIPRLKGILKDL